MIPALHQSGGTHHHPLSLWRALGWLCAGLLVAPTAFSNEPEKHSRWYPFIEGKRWGYIDAQGAWKIPATFDSALAVFEGDRVPVQRDGKWGWIDRAGQWVVPPICTRLNWSPPPEGAQLLTVGKKKGILGRDGSVVLEINYDDIFLSGDRAWVRSAGRLGLFALEGHWILRPSLKWPVGAALPHPLNADGVAWFRRGDRWGLLSSEGKLLFTARFEAHVLGRKESDEWDHPEGLDFKGGRAWVREAKRWLLIDHAGRVRGRFGFLGIAPWSDDLYLFTERGQRSGLISREGKIVLPARFSEIRPLQDGVATVAERRVTKKPNGEKESFLAYGCINASGEFVVPCGDLGPWESYSEGLAPARRFIGGETYDPRAGYVDRQGKEAIAFDYYRTEPFSDGLGAVQLRRPGTATDYIRDLYYGFVDRTGAMVIPPQFEHVTPFIKGRAWVAPQHTWEGSRVATKWAMIDRTGKVLTDWAYDPPEQDQRYHYPENELLLSSRWRGDLAVLSRNGKLGLATTDGRVLIEPRFQTIRPFRNGMAAVIEWDGTNGHGGFVNERGELVIPTEYSQVLDFDGDVTWVTKRIADHRTGRFSDNGWLLIDRAGKLLEANRYLCPNWAPQTDYQGMPKFVGDLACVALADTYDVYAKDPARQSAWGYIDRAGKIVVWHSPDEGKGR